MKKMKSRSPEQWIGDWMNSVATGANKMSARKLASIEKRGGGIKAAASAARKQKVHLVLLVDDRGDKVVAASTRPFKVIA